MSEVVAPANPKASKRPRDAAVTRRNLLDAAWHRFAKDGYASTTVRQIADDAGVNVALISRYFSSKEGLFEACLEQATIELRESTGVIDECGGLAQAIGALAVGVTNGSTSHHALRLLLQSSGDPAGEKVRLGVLSLYAEKIARGVDDHPDRGLLLRAQIVLAAAVGITVLRTSGGIEPLTTATSSELEPPLDDLVRLLFSPYQAAPSS